MEEADLWRAAQFLIVRYGREAVEEAIRRADAQLQQNDPAGLEGYEIWAGIAEKIEELLRDKPSPGEKLH